MTNDEKQILFIDLCARLPYGVKGLHRNQIQRLLVIDSFGSYQMNGYNAWFNLYSIEFKPYLRPMSSMTEEEKKEFDEFVCVDEEAWKGDSIQGFLNQAEIMSDGIDWLNKKMFDYRGLIPMGLALEAPEDMYKED